MLTTWEWDSYIGQDLTKIVTDIAFDPIVWFLWLEQTKKKYNNYSHAAVLSLISNPTRKLHSCNTPTTNCVTTSTSNYQLITHACLANHDPSLEV